MNFCRTAYMVGTSPQASWAPESPVLDLPLQFLRWTQVEEQRWRPAREEETEALSVVSPHLVLLPFSEVALWFSGLVPRIPKFLLVFVNNQSTHFSNILTFKFIYLIWAREWAREYPKQCLHCQWGAPRGDQTHEPWDHGPSRSLTLNWLNHPGAPKPILTFDRSINVSFPLVSLICFFGQLLLILWPSLTPLFVYFQHWMLNSSSQPLLPHSLIAS